MSEQVDNNEKHKWTKQNIVLGFTKYTSYLLNLAIIGAVAWIAYFWVTTLMLAAK